MKLYIVAKNKSVVKEYKTQIKKNGFKYGRFKPDVILSLGGDGTYLVSENKYPGVPKLLIRDSRICSKCSVNLFEGFLGLLKARKYTVEKHIKLDCTFKKKKLVGANDIVVRNKNPQEAIRFTVKVGEKAFELIGDGVTVSTPWGSTGYFESITKKTFVIGIGVALNNVNSKRREIMASEKEKIVVKINRGTATLSADNHKKVYTLKDGDSVVIKKHSGSARVLKIKK